MLTLAVARELDLTASALAALVQQARAERTKGKSGLIMEERDELARRGAIRRMLGDAPEARRPTENFVGFA